MLRWLSGLFVMADLTGCAALLVISTNRFEGPVLASLTANHGLHAGDLVVLAAWALSMIAVLTVLLAGMPAAVLSSSVTPQAPGSPVADSRRASDDRPGARCGHQVGVEPVGAPRAPSCACAGCRDRRP